MPEGPFGGPRFTSIGPFSRKTDMDVASEYLTATDAISGPLSRSTVQDIRVPEAAIRRTIIDLSNFTGMERLPVTVQAISRFNYSGSSGAYKLDPKRIDITIEHVYMTIRQTDRYKPFLKSLLAHEYAHHIVNRTMTNREIRNAIKGLSKSGAFNYKRVDSMPELYDFPAEQFIDYRSLGHFIDHLIELKDRDAEGSRPEKGLANIMAIEYSGLSVREYLRLGAEIKKNWMEILDLLGEDRTIRFPEVWLIKWPESDTNA
jgi:hypothetical protein